MTRARFGAARALALALALLASRAAAAGEDEAVDAAGMQRAMHHYFAGEKSEGVVFMGVGEAALAGSGALFTQHTDFTRGMAYPVLAVGVIELAAGIIVYFRTDAQVARLDARLTAAPAAYRADELARMQQVNREFVWLSLVEMALIGVGAATATVGLAKKSDLAAGVGTGLALQAGAMLAFDSLAAARARAYTDALAGFRF